VLAGATYNLDVRPATTVVMVILLVLLLGAAALQFAVMGKAPTARPSDTTSALRHRVAASTQYR
jgi:flagellar basal body-associated protein FliL